eukprot:SAG31_NODE_1344_length_8699_cov_15.971512_8_plen_70_part_00
MIEKLRGQSWCLPHKSVEQEGEERSFERSIEMMYDKKSTIYEFYSSTCDYALRERVKLLQDNQMLCVQI